MTEHLSDVEQEQMMEDVEMVYQDICDEEDKEPLKERPKKRLKERDYDQLLLKIKRRHESEHALEKTASTVGEAAEWGLRDISEVDKLEHIGQLENVAQGTESFLDKLGHIGHFISNGIGLLLTPWRCIQEKRSPNQDEWVKLGLCAATIIAVAVAMAFPPIGAGLFIAAALFGLIKSVQNIRMKREELHRLKQLALGGHGEITQLNEDIKQLRAVQTPTETQKAELLAKIKKLTDTFSQYVQDAHGAHQLRASIDHPTYTMFHTVNVAMSAVALIGVVLSVFFPPVGAGILIGAGVVSLSVLWVSAMAKWLENQYKPRPHEPTRNIPVKELNEDHSSNHTDDMERPETEAVAAPSEADSEPQLVKPNSATPEAAVPKPAPQSTRIFYPLPAAKSDDSEFDSDSESEEDEDEDEGEGKTKDEGMP